MNFWQAIFLGLVQGLTEFLPVSSSGHLFLIEKFFGTNMGSLSFEIILHIATLLAICVFFWPTIKHLSRKIFLLIFIATLPLIPAVFFLHNWVETVSQSINWIALFLLVSAIANYLSFLHLNKKQKQTTVDKLEKISILTALKIGCMQALAILPGVSRSGITLFASLSNKIEAQTAFQFSFLLSIPAILGALFFDILQSGGENFNSINWNLTIPAMLIAFASGLLSLKLLKGLLNRNRFLILAIYCFILGLTLLIFN